MKRYTVGGCSTYSKVAYTNIAAYPTHAIRAVGAKVQCMVKGMDRWYIDWTASLGAIILGYDDPNVREAVRLENGNGAPLFPLPHATEEEAAMHLCKAVGTEKVRWCKNGSDAIEAAVRIARHATLQDHIITNSYHGSHDALIYATPGKDRGVPVEVCEMVHPAINPAELLAWIKEGCAAAVVMEPFTPTIGRWPLEEIQQQCKTMGVLLIFDEMITGFRTRYGSAAPEVTPDLACYGKAMANGYPLACLTGRTDLMDMLKEKVFMSGTYAADACSLAACTATLQALQKKPYAHIVEATVEIGREMQGLVHPGYTGRRTWNLEEKNVRRILEVLSMKGILVGRDWFPTFAHTNEQIEQTVRAIWEMRRELQL